MEQQITVTLDELKAAIMDAYGVGAIDMHFKMVNNVDIGIADRVAARLQGGGYKNAAKMTEEVMAVVTRFFKARENDRLAAEMVAALGEAE